MEQSEIDYYVDSNREFFRFLVESRQWSGIGIKELNAWIKNFESLPNGDYIACRILDETIGYSESDIIDMLWNAISKIFNDEIVKKLQITSGFNMLKSSLEFEIKKELKKTLFVPLLDKGIPGESGDAILRLMTQKMDINFDKKFHNNIEETDFHKRIIIIDDCIGSGEQFKNFWEEAKICSGKKLREWCKENNVKTYYIVLVGCKDTVLRLMDEYTDCRFICVETISEDYRVIPRLEKDPIYKEIEINLLELLDACGIELYGFNDFDYALFINNNIPDWSLPMLHKKRDLWVPLLRRKDSDV